jgi:hypothetical protein
MPTNADLVLLKLDETGRLDLDQPPSLGTPLEVRGRIRAAVAPPATIKFTESGQGRCYGPGYAVLFSVGTTGDVAEVAVHVDGREANAFRLLRELCKRNGWMLYDRATGRFPDLSTANPLRPGAPPSPPFHWWTRLPAWFRILIGLLIGWLLLNRVLVEIAFP